MEFFEEVQTVRLKSVTGKYLWANEDGRTVRQCREPKNVAAQWRVERKAGHKLIRLKSCYDTYLTATLDDFHWCSTDKLVVQRLSDNFHNKLFPIEWEPVAQHDSNSIMLRCCYGGFLRARKASWPFRRNAVTHTHDSPSNSLRQLRQQLWQVEIVWKSRRH